MAAALSVTRPLVRLRGAWRVGYAAASKDTRRDGTAAPPAAPSVTADRKMEGGSFVIGDVASIQWSDEIAIPLSEDVGGGGVIGGTVALAGA